MVIFHCYVSSPEGTTIMYFWREAHLQVKMYKTPQLRTTFGSWDVEKVHAVVARSIFPSENAQNRSASDHFWKLQCRKSARRCGAKHISKSKCTKHTIPFGSWDVEKVHAVVARSTFPSQNVIKHTRSGPLLEVEIPKKCTPLWREAHFQVKMYKTHQVRTTFGGSDVEKVHAIVARSTFRSEHVQNTRGSDHFWRFRCRFAASLHYTTLRYITPHSTILHYITLHYTPQHYNYNYTTRLHSTTLHYIKLHYTTLHYTTLHYTTLYTLRYTTLPSTTLDYITLHYTPPHSNYSYNYTTTLRYIPLHATTLHYTKLQNYTTLHYTTLHSTTLHYITLHYLPLHFTTLHHTPLHYNYNYDYTTTLHYTKLHYTTLHYTTLHYLPLHCTTFHYTPLHYITLH